MEQEYIEELKAFLKENHLNNKFQDLVESEQAFQMVKKTEEDLVQIQYLRLISRDQKVVRELVQAQEKKVVSFLRSIQQFYLVQPLNTSVQLVLVELLQTLKRLYGPAYKQVIGPMAPHLQLVFNNYPNNIQFLNDVLIEFLLMDSLQMPTILEYLVNPHCKQNKIRTLILIQHHLSDFIKQSGSSLFRHIFHLGLQIQNTQDNQSIHSSSSKEGQEGKDKPQTQNSFVQYLSVLQQIMNSQQVDYVQLVPEIRVLQKMLDRLNQMDIIAQMIMVQIMWTLSQDACLNQCLFSNNVQSVLLLLTDYQESLQLQSINIPQQSSVQQEVLQQLFRLLRQFYQLDSQRHDINFILDVDVLQTFVQIDDLSDIDEYVLLVEQYTSNFSNQYLARYQQVFNNPQLALSNIHLLQPNQQPLNGHLQVLSKIGKGAFGTVYLCNEMAISPLSSGQVALKEIADKTVWQIESSILAGLKHRNIVSYQESFQQNDQYYLAMQYIQGVSLAQLIKFNKQADPQSINRQWRLFDIRKIALQLIEAIYYLHRRQIVHRDLNPTNIMIDQDCTLFLIDFGFALDKTTHSNQILPNNHPPHKTKEFVGTLTYTAPEVINRTECDSRMDIWSLGCVLFELLYRKQVFQQENNVLQLAKEIFDGNIQFNDLENDLFPQHQQAFAQKLLEITRKCLVKEASQRITIVQILSTLAQEFMEYHLELQEQKEKELEHYRLGQSIAQHLQSVQDLNNNHNKTVHHLLTIIHSLFVNQDPHYKQQFQQILEKKKTLVFIHETIYQKDYSDLYNYLLSNFQK